MKAKLLLFTVIIETIVIGVFSFKKFEHHDFLIFENKSEFPYPYDLSFVFSKSKDTYGDIALDDSGNLASFFLQDKAGRLITASFTKEHIASYVIQDKKSDYEIATYFPVGFPSFTDNEKFYKDTGESNVIMRTEKYSGTKKAYEIDYSSVPFISDVKKTFQPDLPVNP